MSKRSVSCCLALAGVLALYGCQAEEPVEDEAVLVPEVAPQASPAPGQAEEAEIAAAELSGPGGVTGVVTFTEQPGGVVQVVARVDNAPPGRHGIHVHENGVCEPPTFESAGGHFNPTGAPHGGPEAPQHHAGDLGNIEIGEDGTGHLDLTSRMLSVGEGPGNVVGKAVILHAQPDDLTSQPSGAAGDRIACGVVELAEGAVEPAMPAAAAPGEAI